MIKVGDGLWPEPIAQFLTRNQLAALAFLLHHAIEKKLKAAHLDLSATEALTALRSVRVVDIDPGEGTFKRSVTRGTQRAAAALRALGIVDRDPPAPPQQGETVM